MAYELYEVWAEPDTGGCEELIETTKSRTHAYKLAEECLNDGFFSATVYQETDDGDRVEVKRIESD